MARILPFLILVLLLASCEPAATPFPVELAATATPTLPPSTPVPIRYALAPNTAGLIADLTLMQGGGIVQQLSVLPDPTGIGSEYDVVVIYGDFNGWTRASAPTISLVIGPDMEPALADILRRAIDAQGIIAALDISGATAASSAHTPAPILRIELANMGRPDGFGINLGYAYTPGASQITAQLTAANIQSRLSLQTNTDLQSALIEGRLQAGLIMWLTPDERQSWADRFGSAQVIDLYTVPISYLAAPDLVISLTPGGWPLARRQP